MTNRTFFKFKALANIEVWANKALNAMNEEDEKKFIQYIRECMKVIDSIEEEERKEK